MADQQQTRLDPQHDLLAKPYFYYFYLFSLHFFFFFTICLVNLPMSPRCGGWTACLFHEDDPYIVAGFWRQDINFVFMSTLFGWFFICCGLFWSCLQLLLLWSLALPFSSCFRCCYLFFSHVWPWIAPIYCVYTTHLLFCEHEQHGASYSGVWFPPNQWFW